MMTTGHIFYIPVVLLVGLILGYAMGRRAEEQAQAKHGERAGGRERRRGRAGRRRRRRVAESDEGEVDGPEADDDE